MTQMRNKEALVSDIYRILNEANADERDMIAVSFWLLSNVANSSIAVGDHKEVKAHLDKCWGKFMATKEGRRL